MLLDFTILLIFFEHLVFENFYSLSFKRSSGLKMAIIDYSPLKPVIMNFVDVEYINCIRIY